MKLPVPFWVGNRLYAEAEFKRPMGGAIADAKRAADDGNPYLCMILFAAGGVASLVSEEHTEDDPGQIRSAIREAPYCTAEWLGFQVLSLLKRDAPVEVNLSCRCGKQWTEESPALSDLPVAGYEPGEGEGPVPEPVVELSYPVELGAKDWAQTVGSIKFKVPTIEACSKALKKMGLADKTRFSFVAWAESILLVDGREVDPKWRNTWGLPLFERMDAEDADKVAKALGAFGVESTFPVRCPKCGRTWDAEVPTEDFFGSALRG